MNDSEKMYNQYALQLRDMEDVVSDEKSDQDGIFWTFISDKPQALKVELRLWKRGANFVALTIDGVDCDYWHTAEEETLDYHIKLAKAAILGEVLYNRSPIFKFKEVCFKVDNAWDCTLDDKSLIPYHYIKTRKNLKSTTMSEQTKRKKICLPISMLEDQTIPDSFLRSLHRAGYDDNEASLIRCIKDNKSKNLTYYAVIALKKYGTNKSIEILKTLTNYPMADVKTCSVLTIGKIAGNEETAYYAHLLDSKYPHKMYVMSVIWEVADVAAYESVIRLADKVIAKKIKMICQSDSLYVAEYIERYASNPRDFELANRIRELGCQLNPV